MDPCGPGEVHLHRLGKQNSARGNDGQVAKLGIRVAGAEGRVGPIALVLCVAMRHV